MKRRSVVLVCVVTGVLTAVAWNWPNVWSRISIRQATPEEVDKFFYWPQKHRRMVLVHRWKTAVHPSTGTESPKPIEDLWFFGESSVVMCHRQFIDGWKSLRSTGWLPTGELAWQRVQELGAGMEEWYSPPWRWDARDQSERTKDLRWAYLERVSIVGMDLRLADLSNAILRDVQLRDVDLTGAIFEGAHFKDCDLRHATGLTLDQVRTATTWENCVLSSELQMALERIEEVEEGRH